MTEFTAGQKVKLKDDVAKHLENTIGTWNHEFAGLIGLVGWLEGSTNFPEQNDWIFTTPTKSFGVNENEIEAVQE